MDKPAGLTSHDVVARTRKVLRTKAVGHTGTLDPFATGLLVLLVGPATRLARFVEAEAKTYRATMRFGQRTDTDDATGRVIGGQVPEGWPGRGVLAEALAAMRGKQEQRPPAYSAKHVDGERSHRLARRGLDVELPPVPVTVHHIELLEWTPPDATFRATVSAGTYIRALARDLGEHLGFGAHLVALRREAIGTLRVEEAVALEALGPEAVRSPLAVLQAMPSVPLDDAALVRVRHGRRVDAPPGTAGTVALLSGGELVAIAERAGNELQPVVVLPTEPPHGAPPVGEAAPPSGAGS